jgi:DNA-directed RNA polymerase sigma subunit (sigma70/sigma32)
MIRKTLTEQETGILCAYYGLQTKRLTVNKIAEKHLLPERRVLKIVRESERKLQFSDDAIEIWKYLYRR